MIELYLGHGNLRYSKQRVHKTYFQLVTYKYTYSNLYFHPKLMTR